MDARTDVVAFDPASGVRAADKAARRLREQALWSEFGTIGFDAYKAWVLAEDTRRAAALVSAA